jgi:acetolactate synthase-1/2/3 large subunit
MPDFEKLCAAYGIGAEVVTSRDQLSAAFDRAEATPGPYLIDFRIDPEANVYPIVPLGKGLNDFWEHPGD